MSPKNLSALAAATILFSLVGVLIKLIHLPSGSIALARALIAGSVLLGFLALRRQPLLVLHHRSDLVPLCLLGLFMGGNWYFYFVSIKVSTVAVAVISLFTYPLITSLLEPLLLRTRLQAMDCAAAVVVVAGVALVVPRFQLGNAVTLGVLFGILSALSLSLCNITNKKLVQRYAPEQMMVYQFLVAALLFLPAMGPLTRPIPPAELGWLVALGALLTTVSIFLFINSFKHLAASTASILTSLQPFLTVLFAFLMLGEVPAGRTMAGGLLICSTVVAVSLGHTLRRAPSTGR